LNGYVRTVRKQKRVAFAAIGDGSTLQTVQAVLSPELAEGSVEHFIYSDQADVD
jgi:asparaginyl-tRNA synthetase